MSFLDGTGYTNSRLGGATPCGEVSTRGTIVFVLDLLELY